MLTRPAYRCSLHGTVRTHSTPEFSVEMLKSSPASFSRYDVKGKQLLKTLEKYYPKFLLTLDEDPSDDFNGIRKLNALDWLLQ
jgi:hypothetical protein